MLNALSRLARSREQCQVAILGQAWGGILSGNTVQNSALQEHTFQSSVSITSHASPAFKRTGGLGKQTVAVAISGGVDSAVAAHIVKQQGHEVFGIFMRNWDESEEKGNQNCSVEADFHDAVQVCKHIGIPLYQADFISEYWNQVFLPFISQMSRGLTPNPDLQCNRQIKFQALLDHAETLGADVVATGHYACLRHSENGPPELLRAVDHDKDQTYFLASVPGTSFGRVIFPLGGLLKSEVREIARETGLHVASRRSSTGICFIGRRSFGAFVEEYSKPVPGSFVDVESGLELGKCKNILSITLGQKSGLSGQKEKMFVVGKDVQGKLVYVSAGAKHPALYSHSALLASPHWISGKAPQSLEATGKLDCHYIARYRQTTQSCHVKAAVGSGLIAKTQFISLAQEDLPGDNASTLEVHLPEAARSLTPQQSFVMYNGDHCLGSAPIIYPGQTVWEERHVEDPTMEFAGVTC